MFDTQTGYGWVSRVIHWLMAISIVAMFALGLWMRDLDYYSPYYKTAPDIHKGVGIFLLGLLVVRLAWRALNRKPSHGGVSVLEQRASTFVHWVLYPLLFLLMVSGYLISTADGRAINVFGLFSVPSVITQKGLEAIAGQIHYYTAFVVIAIASAHALAALYHHFFKRDDVLRSMTVGGGQKAVRRVPSEIPQSLK
ncbi:MAG: cytochrome b [Pseudomonadota bacterium]